MRISRWLELVSGLAAGFIGLAIIAFTMFGPSYSGGSCAGDTGSGGTLCTTSTATFAQVNHGYPPLALLYFGVLAGVLLSVIVSTLLHWRFGGSGLRRCLWATVVLLLLVAIAGFDLWVLMLPSLLLTLVAALAALNNRPVAAGT